MIGFFFSFISLSFLVRICFLSFFSVVVARNEEKKWNCYTIWYNNKVAITRASLIHVFQYVYFDIFGAVFLGEIDFLFFWPELLISFIKKKVEQFEFVKLFVKFISPVNLLDTAKQCNLSQSMRFLQTESITSNVCSHYPL